MELIKKILILLVVIIFIYILLRLLRKRIEIIPKVEGFTDATVKKIADSASSKPVTIRKMSSSYGSLPISNFFVKSSLNSAYNGSSVSIDMVNYVLSRGYRFLDFEVYLEPLTTTENGSPIATVAYSNMISGSRISSNNIKLGDVITAILQGAFTSTSPNSSDPLFLQIRPMYKMPSKSDDSATSSFKQGNNTQLNTQIETALELLKEVLAGAVYPSSTMASVSGKVVLIMDSNNINGKKSSNLLSMISIDSKYINTINTGIVTAIPIKTTTPSPRPTSNPVFIQTLPFDNNGMILTDNPNINTVISQFSPNFSPMMVWMYNSYSGLLETYENLFENNGNSAFIELSSLVSNANVATKLNSPIVGP
jgi:hypothetical protein